MSEDRVKAALAQVPPRASLALALAAIFLWALVFYLHHSGL